MLVTRGLIQAVCQANHIQLTVGEVTGLVLLLLLVFCLKSSKTEG